MQDGAPCHRAKVTTNFLRENIAVLEWPGNSPDLNPIENLWEVPKDEVAAGSLQVLKTYDELSRTFGLKKLFPSTVRT